MKESFRQCMAWLHTWTGLVMGWVLFFVFITGTAGYVRPELNRWMEPERPLTQNNLPTLSQQFNKAYDWLSQHENALHAERWLIYLQTQERDSSDFHVGWQELPKKGKEIGQFHKEFLDLHTGQTLALENTPRDTGGGDALYRMHYELHYLPYDWAIRIVGICTMLMFVAIITGIITHKKIFKDFFTFRPAKGQRSWLDAHNVLSVIALPFHLMITYSGLMFFLNVYMPLGVPMTYGFGKENEQHYFNELYQIQSEEKDINNRQSIADVKDRFIDLKKLVQKKEQQWGIQSIRIISIYPPNAHEPARIEFYKSGHENLARSAGSEQYNLITGELINEKKGNPQSIPLKFSDTMFALHEGNFADSLIRCAYVITGLIGSAMIATGLVIWTVKRRIKATKAGKVSFGHQLVEKLNIATIAGLPFAIAMYFWANRLIPVPFDGRADWELHSLFIAWLLTLIYAIFRPLLQAWREILALAAFAWLLLPILNFCTTDRHLGVAIPYGAWVLVNIEIGFMLIGLLLLWATWKVQNKINTSLPIKRSAKRIVNDEIF